MSGKVLFMVKRQFFDAIESGDKNSEWRGSKKWRWVHFQRPTEAVFMSGRRILRKRIIGIYLHEWKSAPLTVQAIYPTDEMILEISLADGVIE